VISDLLKKRVMSLDCCGNCCSSAYAYFAPGPHLEIYADTHVACCLSAFLISSPMVRIDVHFTTMIIHCPTRSCWLQFSSCRIALAINQYFQ